MLQLSGVPQPLSNADGQVNAGTFAHVWVGTHVVAVAVLVGMLVFVSVGVLVGMGVFVSVGVLVGMGVFVSVGVLVGMGVGVFVGVYGTQTLLWHRAPVQSLSVQQPPGGRHTPLQTSWPVGQQSSSP